MGLFDRFKKPKWQHKDWKVRLEAVQELNDQKIKKELDLDDKLSISKDALSKLNSTINKISQNDITEIRNTWESFNFGKFLIFIF